ncbi:MAG TPA: thiolase family protein [Thermodesulfobacteriota bacterium]|nr:thiolase family protein [Thermodesulfobacteriota bacterium]
MTDVVVLSAARTPIGAFQGALAPLAAPQLGAAAIRAAVARAGLEPGEVDEVLMGQVVQAGSGQAPARQAAVGAGLPLSVGATTVNKVCGSGLKAVMLGAQAIRSGESEVVVAGGMESMSNAPYLLDRARAGYRLGDALLLDALYRDGLVDPFSGRVMGLCAELCAAEYAVGREAQDAYALESYRRARDAIASGAFAREVVPVEVPRPKGGAATVDTDEEPGRVDLARVASLKPAFKPDGTVTPANASKLNDGAAAVVLASERRAAALGRRPLARIVAQASAAREPEWFTVAPADAIRALLRRVGRHPADVDLYEINEAFAVVAIVVSRLLDLPPERVNVRGGAVALGHPVGASGARILVTLLHAMADRGAKTGVAAICLGGGEAVALLVERA